MQLAKWGNSFAIRVPADVVKALDLREGDDIDVTIEGQHHLSIARRSTLTRKEALQRIRALARPLPAGWKFDREEASARR